MHQAMNYKIEGMMERIKEEELAAELLKISGCGDSLNIAAYAIDALIDRVGLEMSYAAVEEVRRPYAVKFTLNMCDQSLNAAYIRREAKADL